MQAVRETRLGNGPEVTFAFWSVQADIVVENCDRFARHTGTAMRCLEVSGDYADWMKAGFANGQAPMVFYAQRAEASVWDAQGHLAALDEVALAAALSGMDARLVAGARNMAGDLIGLTYYNGGPFALFHHADHPVTDAAALTTWDGVLDHLREVQRGGMAHPFVPRWHHGQTGLVWSLLCHLASEGVTDLATANAPAVLFDALTFLRALWAEGLVPPEAISDRGDVAAVERWASGQHALTFTMDYLASDAARMAGRPISTPLPRLPGATGAALMPGHALLCLNVATPPARRDAALALLAYLGGAEVHRRWLTECLFAVPRPDLDSDPAVRAAMAQAFAPANATASLACLVAARQAATVSPATHAPWFLTWSADCDRIVRDRVLRGTLSPQAATDALLARWHHLVTS